MKLNKQLVQDKLGNARVGVSVTVYVAGSQTRPILYAANDVNGEHLGNPLTTDNDGYANFYVADGVYDIVVGTGDDAITYPQVQIYDLDTFKQQTASDAADAANVAVGGAATAAASIAATSVRQQLAGFTLAQAATHSFDSAVNGITVSGTEAVGDEGAGMQLVYDAAVDAAYVSANPTTSFLDAGGRGYRQARRKADDIDFTPDDTATTRPTKSRLADTVSIKDYGTLGDGTDATAAFTAARAAAIARGISRIIVPPGHYLINDHDIADDGLIFEGDGDTSRITADDTNATMFNVTGDLLTFKGLKLEGSGTRDDGSSLTGRAFYGTGERLTLEDIWFDGFGNGPLIMKNTAATRIRGPRIHRCRVRNTMADAFAEIQIGGGFENIVLDELDCLTTNGVQRAVLISPEGSGYWVGVMGRGGWFEGYSWQGIGASDELWDGTDRCFGFEWNGGYFRNIGSSAIKVKLSKGIIIQSIIADGCGNAPENPNAGLYGAILCNSIGTIQIKDNILRNNGSAGIVTNGNDAYSPTAPVSKPSGFGLASIQISGNQIEGTGKNATYAAFGDAIAHIGNCKAMIVANNQIRDCIHHGVYLNSGNSGLLQHVSIKDNLLADSASSTGYGIYAKGVFRLAQDGNTVFNWSGSGVNFENCTHVAVGPCDRSGDSATASRCYTFNNVLNVTFAGSASCTFYSARAASTAYAVGDRVVLSDNVVECVIAGTTGSGSAPTIAVDDVVADGTVTWGYVHKYRKNNAGIYFAGTCQLARVTSGARFNYIVGLPIDGSAIPANLERTSIQSGTATLASGTKAVSLNMTEYDANYRVSLTGYANETFYVSVKTTTGFTINSSSGTSTTNVDYKVSR